MDRVQQYLLDELQKSSTYQPTSEDALFIKKRGIEEFIFMKLMSKKFRKWKLDPDCETRTKKAIHINVQANMPIQVVFFLGAYKLWRLPSSPEVDWAEFFNISYLIKYLSSIAANYKKGVELTYYLHTLLMEKHDNLTTDEINAYIKSFTLLIDSFSTYLPSNFRIKIIKDSDIYPREEYFKKLEEGVVTAKEECKTLPFERIETLKKLGRLNIKWKGKENWTILSKEEQDEKIYNGILYEMAASNNLPKVVATVKSNDKVLLFTVPSKTFIGIGSTRNSIVKFWTGFGVLEQNNTQILNRILSPSQLEKIKNIEYKNEPISLIPLKNLGQIRIYPKPFDFTHQ